MQSHAYVAGLVLGRQSSCFFKQLNSFHGKGTTAPLCIQVPPSARIRHISLDRTPGPSHVFVSTGTTFVITVSTEPLAKGNAVLSAITNRIPAPRSSDRDWPAALEAQSAFKAHRPCTLIARGTSPSPPKFTTIVAASPCPKPARPHLGQYMT